MTALCRPAPFVAPPEPFCGEPRQALARIAIAIFGRPFVAGDVAFPERVAASSLAIPPFIATDKLRSFAHGPA